MKHAGVMRMKHAGMTRGQIQPLPSGAAAGRRTGELNGFLVTGGVTGAEALPDLAKTRQNARKTIRKKTFKKCKN